MIASQLIEKLEISQRFKIKRALYKKPRHSILKQKPVKSSASSSTVVVEIQTVYPIHDKQVRFSQRLSTDVRDGYMELLPGQSEFQNVYQKQIDISVQSAPERVDLEQQTDPIFPTNAWTQYLYEITREVADKEPAPESEAEAKGTEEELEEEQSIVEEEDQKPIVVSKQISELMKTLKFNNIDMYRNDYGAIGQMEVPKFRKPYLTEELCFSNISKTGKRVVSSIAWHPR